MAGQTALIVVEMLNTYEHEDAELLTESVAEAVGPMSDPVTGPTDAVPQIHKPLADSAFEIMRRNMDAELVRSEEVRWTRS